MRTRHTIRVFATVLAITASLGAAGCGGTDDGAETSALAQQLLEPMDEAARAIDQVRGTRSSLDALQSKLTRSVDATSDAIAVLLPKAADDPVVQKMLDAARDQRSFLQSAIAATRARNRGSIADAVGQMESNGRLASGAYARLRSAEPELAGLLPQSASFNSGRLRDAARKAVPAKPTPTRKPSSSAPAAAAPSAPPASSGNGGVNGRASLDRSCDPNIEFDPSTTSCGFAKNVFRAYSAATQSGGSYDTTVVATGTDGGARSMTCTLDGGTVTCFGAREALVEFPRWASDAY